MHSKLQWIRSSRRPGSTRRARPCRLTSSMATSSPSSSTVSSRGRSSRTTCRWLTRRTSPISSRVMRRRMTMMSVRDWLPSIDSINPLSTVYIHIHASTPSQSGYINISLDLGVSIVLCGTAAAKVLPPARYLPLLLFHFPPLFLYLLQSSILHAQNLLSLVHAFHFLPWYGLQGGLELA